MIQQLTVGIFPTDSPQGKDLLDQIIVLAKNWKLDLEIYPPANGIQVLWQCRTKDIIIFDASIEDEATSNYIAVTGFLIMCSL